MSVLTNYEGIVRDRFVETGTFEGTTLALAAEHFEECLSCEIDRANVVKALTKFYGVPNVRLYNLDSKTFLRDVLDHRIPTTFWLDAHYDGKALPSPLPECPILDELFEITRLNWRTPPIILIDDAEIFLGDGLFAKNPGYWKREEWPTLDEINTMLSGFRMEIQGPILKYYKL